LISVDQELVCRVVSSIYAVEVIDIIINDTILSLSVSYKRRPLANYIRIHVFPVYSIVRMTREGIWAGWLKSGLAQAVAGAGTSAKIGVYLTGVTGLLSG